MVSAFSSPRIQRGIPLPADPDERSVARRGLRGLPGHTRTTSSWHCRQITRSSWLSPTVLHPTWSPRAWILIVVYWSDAQICTCLKLQHPPPPQRRRWPHLLLRTHSAVESILNSTHSAWLFAGSHLHPAEVRICSIMSASPSTRLVPPRGVAVFTHGCRRVCCTWSARSSSQIPAGILLLPRKIGHKISSPLPQWLKGLTLKAYSQSQSNYVAGRRWELRFKGGNRKL